MVEQDQLSREDREGTGGKKQDEPKAVNQEPDTQRNHGNYHKGD